MKTLLSKNVLCALLFVPAMLMAHDGKFKGKYTKEKTIKKEYTVNPTATLKVNNSYGNLVLTSWNEDRVVIEVVIKTNGNNEEKVQERLDEINVMFEASADMVSAKTDFNKGKDGWNWKWSKNNNVNMQVNYTIKLPVKNSIYLNNDYGNITLDRIDGYAKINCDYGRLEIGELRGRNNNLNFDYTSKSVIEYMNSGEIRADYSGFELQRTGDLILKADYTNASIGTMENLEYSSDYGQLEANEVNNVKGSGDYINVRLGTVNGSVDIVADYGAIKIAKMASDAGNIKIRSDYTGIKIGYDPGYNFDFEINTEYAGVNGKEDFELNISKQSGSNRYYKGYHGTANSGRNVEITADYGSITFYKN